MKKKITDYISDTYGVEADYPFADSPHTEIFRNPRNKKWFAALLGQLSPKCLGLNGEKPIDVLNLKCDPIMTFSLIDNQKVFRAYHMNKEHWVSVLLDSHITLNELSFLVDMSYRLVDRAAKPKNKK